MKTVVYVIVIIFTFIGCGNNNDDETGGGNDSYAPAIISVTLYKYDSGIYTETNSFEVGDYYSYEIEASDSDSNALIVWQTTYIGVTSNIFSGPSNMQQVYMGGGTHVTIESPFPHDEINYPPDSYRFEYQLEDLEGNISSPSHIYFTVTD